MHDKVMCFVIKHKFALYRLAATTKTSEHIGSTIRLATIKNIWTVQVARHERMRRSVCEYKGMRCANNVMTETSDMQ